MKLPLSQHPALPSRILDADGEELCNLNDNERATWENEALARELVERTNRPDGISILPGVMTLDEVRKANRLPGSGETGASNPDSDTVRCVRMVCVVMRTALLAWYCVELLDIARLHLGR